MSCSNTYSYCNVAHTPYPGAHLMPMLNMFSTAGANSNAFAAQLPQLNVSRSTTLELLLQVTRQLAHGIAVLDSQGQTLFANDAALKQFELPVWHHQNGRLHCTALPDNLSWLEMLAATQRHGIHRIFDLGMGGVNLSVALSPLPVQDDSYVLLTLGRAEPCGQLEVQLFARTHHLTATETEVLQCLRQGYRPAAIAALNGVALSTVTSHLSAIRIKTGSQNINALLRQLACLPTLKINPQLTSNQTYC